MAPRLPKTRSGEDAQRAFLFRCAGDDELHALSLALSPEPVLRGLRHAGFYVWKAPSGPTATTQ